MVTSMSEPTVAPVSSVEVLDAARALGGDLSARADEGEAAGTLPVDLVARARAAGLFRTVQPRALGGLELEPATIVQVVEELSRADGSAGWTLMIGSGAAGFAAWLDPDVAVELFGTQADFTSACVFAPTGRAVPDGAGRFTIEGRWPFASGCRHAEWFLNGVFVFDGDAPRMLPDRGPDWRLAYFPREQAEIIDNWDVLGLRGTGSNDIAASGLSVPEEHTISPFHEPARQPGALWRLPFFTLVGVTLAGVPLGIARRALDEFTALAPVKTRAGSFEALALDSATQAMLARAEGDVQSARAFVFDALGSLWETACAGDVPSVAQRARFQLAAQQAMHSAVAAVDRVFTATGAAAVHSAHPLQRCFRDLHTAQQHIYFSDAALQRSAKTRFNIEQPTFTL
jgi:alkylation response protein AidB-like acyl-CoA dehydrogenase